MSVNMKKFGVHVFGKRNQIHDFLMSTNYQSYKKPLKQIYVKQSKQKEGGEEEEEVEEEWEGIPFGLVGGPPQIGGGNQ